MQLMGCINHTNTDTYVNIMMNRKEKPDGAKAAQVLSQQEREQQTRDLKQQDTKLNALTKKKGNVPLIFKNCVVLFPPTGHIYLNLHLFCIFFFRSSGEERTKV